MPADRTDDRLDSWKEIASYLKKGVRTVQRWERVDGLPVRRLGQERTGSVFAYKSELDAWWEEQSRSLTLQRESEGIPEPAVKPATPRARWRLPLVLSLIALSAAAIFWRIWPTAPIVYRPIPLTTDLGWEIQPSFSPDGRQIAYVRLPKRGQASIYTKSIGADSSVRLTSSTHASRLVGANPPMTCASRQLAA